MEVGENLIETTVFGTVWVVVAQMPLTDHGCAITVLPEMIAKGFFAAAQKLVIAVRLECTHAHIVSTGHQRGTRGGATADGDVVIEDNCAFREPIQVWRVDEGVAITPQHLADEVVDINDQHIGLSLGGGGLGCYSEASEQEAQNCRLNDQFHVMQHQGCLFNSTLKQ